ncbi:Organic cation transporter protein [Lamellibrachia satsuma]|nr:Organic cation transporter protein [Lamellibrachia satsuma]
MRNVSLPSRRYDSGSLTITPECRKETGGHPKHRCRLPDNVSLNESIPYQDVDGERQYDSCYVYDNYSRATNRTIPCPLGWEYEHDSFTITEEWNLVCDKNYGSDTTQLALVFGVLIGAMSMTAVSDKFGRKRTFLFNLCAGSFVTFVTAWVNNYYLFTALRFLVGVFQQGAMLCGFVLGCELFSAKQRTMAGLLLTMYWPVGMVLLAAAAYFTRHWRHLLIVTSMPGLFLVPLFWIIPESVPWLIAKNREAEAKRILQTAARWNKVQLPEKYRPTSKDDISSVLTNGDVDQKVLKLNRPLMTRTEQPDEDTKQYTVLDILASPKLRVYALVMFYLWFVVCLVYYGLSLSIGTLAGNKYVNFCLSAAVEAPANVMCALLLKYIGRRWPIFMFLITAGISLIITLFIPNTTVSGVDLSILTITFSMIGKFGISAAFGAVFLYASEIFPTTVRNVGLGMASVGGRTGNMLAPYTTYFAHVAPWLPGVLFGTISVVGGVLTLLLPETLGRPLPQTMQEVEQWTRRISKREKQRLKLLTSGGEAVEKGKCEKELQS